ncbi:Uncharacterised protein [Salmonella enterica subsp. enterica serovar Bovismorbificans]|uniref:Uncharacterized protein n=1 Tax=Salmonella enterica subsp. enterica serovar Bovismorbificans TaxID=58097 RepID=A0A655BLX6_SALET|nr:Uncharacterised protein [Salmonella enterica subsp. enterica serovar Bovismorbificans]
MARVAIHINFTEHRERDAPGAGTIGFNLLFAAWLLPHKLVAGKTQHDKPLICPRLLDIFQLFILRRQATSGGDVYNEQHFSGVFFKCSDLSINRRNVSIKKRVLHGVSLMSVE